jgi:hypothetical protein
LRTGARIKGKIVLQNEEVVIVRDAEGARFQYPRAEVVEIVEDEAEEVTSPDSEISTNQVATTKKASILLELSAAPAIMVPMAVGGNANVDLLAGSHHIGDKHIFIGGGLGYHGYFMGGDVYNFLPIEAKLSMPLIEAKHAPFFGFALGYGIALSKDYVGGIYTGLDFGYRYQINPKSALALMVFASFQQARLNIIETIEGNEYINKSGRSFVSPGIKLALYF